jgi:hypothetical protein
VPVGRALAAGIVLSIAVAAVALWLWSRTVPARSAALSSNAPSARGESSQNLDERLSVARLELASDRPATAEAIEVRAGEFELSGRVVDGSGDGPIEGADVSDPDSPTAAQRTDASGRFAWRGDEAPLALRVSAPGYLPIRVPARRSRAGAVFEVRLWWCAAIDARVEGGARRFDRIAVIARAQNPGGGAGGEELADAGAREVQLPHDGRALLGELPPRVALDVELRAADGTTWRRPDAIVLEPGEMRVVELEPRALARLAVHVADARGAPVADAKLWLVRRPASSPKGDAACFLQFEDRPEPACTARSDSAGVAIFEEVPSGRWWLGPARADAPAPEARDAALAPVARSIDVMLGERELELRVERGLYLRGRIVDAEGRGVARAFVGCEHETIAGSVTGDVDADGRFVLGPVASGVHLVRALPHAEFVTPEPVRATPEEPEIVLVLERGGVLAGSVVDASTHAPPEIADLICARPGGAPALATIGPDGRFRFDGLLEDRYTILATTRDGRAGMLAGIALARRAARTDLVVELGPASSIRASYTGGRYRATVRLQCGDAVLDELELARGVAHAWTVPAGRFTLALHAGSGFRASREIETRAGATSDVEFPLD